MNNARRKQERMPVGLPEDVKVPLGAAVKSWRQALLLLEAHIRTPNSASTS